MSKIVPMVAAPMVAVSKSSGRYCKCCSKGDLQFIGWFCACIIFGGCLIFAAFYIDIDISIRAERHSVAFQVDFLEVNSMKFDPPDAHFRLNFTVVSRVAKLFNNLETTIEYDRNVVSTTIIAPFRQDALSVQTIPVSMSMSDTRLSDKVIDSIRNKLASDAGFLEFTLIVHGVTWKIDNDDICDMKMVCNGVKVTLLSSNNTWNGSTKNGPFLCQSTSNKGCDV